MRRRRLAIDLGAAIWTALWIVVAVQVAIEVRGLRDLSSTVIKTGEAVHESGEALQRLDGVPIVGGELDGSGGRIADAGQSAVESGKSSRESIRNLSLLLGLAIGVIPPVAIVGVYLHLRGARPLRGAPSRSRRARRQAMH